MATVPSALYQDSDYWDGTTSWGGFANQVLRDAYYTGGGFTSITDWVNDRDGNSQAGDIERLEIIGPWGIPLVEVHFDIDSFSSDSCEIVAIGDARNNGIVDGSGCIVNFEAGNGIDMEESVTLDGFQINTTGDYCIQRSTADNCTIQDMIFKYGGAWHCYDDDTVGGTVNVINCVFFSTNLGNGTGIHGEGAGATINLYNTTIYGFNSGVYEDNATINVTNCAVCNNNDDFGAFSTGTISFCASDDEDGANSQLLDNTNNYQDEFTDAPNGDFTLPVGSICIENGTDNPSGGLYSDDIISVARSSTWDIGVFEYVGGGGPAAPKLPIGLLVGVY